MSLNKSLCLALGVTAGMLIATNAMATDYAESFESCAEGASLELAGWGGYGTYSNTTAEARTLLAGTPLVTPTTHNIHLAVDGWVTNTLTTAGDAQLDMLVKVACPDEPLSGMSDTEAKFAMAIDQDGTLKYWDGDSWESLGLSAFTENTWIRVAVVYNNGTTVKRCKVSVNGNACVTPNGYTDATGSETGGPWYPTLDQSMTQISSLKVVGTTALDDIKVTYETSSSYAPTYQNADGSVVTVSKTPATGAAIAVPLGWFDQNNVATATNTATDGSGMTIADKYQTGIDPNSGEKFEMKSMSMTKDGSTVTAEITVPACNPPTGMGTVKIQTSADKSSWSAGTAVDPGATSASVDLSSGNVTYFRMVLDK